MNRVPQFCSVCGSRLQATNRVSAYDPYTGEPVQSSRLHCSNPTVEVTGSRLNRKTATITHPTWSLIEGVWSVD